MITEQPPKYTLEQVKDACVLVGISESEAQAIYDYWHSQDWTWANGRPITNLVSGLRRMRNYQQAKDLHLWQKVKGGLHQEKKCLGRNCYKRGPAERGPDDTGQMYYLCDQHKPKERKR